MEPRTLENVPSANGIYMLEFCQMQEGRILACTANKTFLWSELSMIWKFSLIDVPVH